MRTLKLQIQLSIDGYISGPNGEMDWMKWDWDDELKEYTRTLTNSFDTIILGRKMTNDFISHWSNVAENPKDSEYEAAKKFIETPKVVFTKTLEESKWENTTLAKGKLKDEIYKLKNQKGKDIIVYGGGEFVSSLIKENLIDEYYLFINPSILGSGMPIFKNVDYKMNLKLENVKAYDCGITVLKYTT